MSTDNLNTEVTEPQTPAAEPSSEPVGEPSGGTQPTSDPAPSTPAQETKPGSDTIMIPKPRLDEALVRMHRAEAELARLRQPQPPPQSQGPAQPPKAEDFNGDWDAFNKATIAYEVQQGIQQFHRQQQQAQMEAFRQNRAIKADLNFSQKLTEAVAKDPNVLSMLQAAPPLRDDLQVNLKEHKDPVGLAKHLVQNPNLVFEMNNLPPDLAVQRMWEIGQSLAGASGQPQPKVSQMPKPMTPVNGGKSTGGGGSGLDKALSILYPT